MKYAARIVLAFAAMLLLSPLSLAIPSTNCFWPEQCGGGAAASTEGTTRLLWQNFAIGGAANYLNNECSSISASGNRACTDARTRLHQKATIAEFVEYQLSNTAAVATDGCDLVLDSGGGEVTGDFIAVLGDEPEGTACPAEDCCMLTAAADNCTVLLSGANATIADDGFYQIRYQDRELASSGVGDCSTTATPSVRARVYGRSVVSP